MEVATEAVVSRPAELSQSSLLTILAVLALAMLIVTYFAGILPIYLKTCLERSGKGSQRWLSLLTCFSGGVFLATTFLDLIPHVMTVYSELTENGYYRSHFPLSTFMMCAGFFFVYVMEQAIMTLFMRKPTSGSSDSTLEEQERLSTTHEIVFEEAVMYVVSDTADKRHNLIKTITFTLAISFHSLLEGFALGVQDTQAAIVSLFLSLIIHKGIEAFGVGLQVSKGGQKRWHFLITVGIYSIMTPIGIGLGAALQTASIDNAVKDVLTALLTSMACGTFMYVTFLEILAEEKARNEHQNQQLVAIILGFCVITALQFVFDE